MENRIFHETVEYGIYLPMNFQTRRYCSINQENYNAEVFRL